MAEGTGLIKRFYTEVIGDGNLALIDELVSDDFVDHNPMPGQSPSKDGVGFFVNTMRAAFPDLKATTSEPALVDGNLEALYVVLTGTHKGELMVSSPPAATSNSAASTSSASTAARSSNIGEPRTS